MTFKFSKAAPSEDHRVAFVSAMRRLARTDWPARSSSADIGSEGVGGNLVRARRTEIRDASPGGGSHNLAKKFRDRILRLAHTFDQAEELQTEFSELYSAIRTTGR